MYPTNMKDIFKFFYGLQKKNTQKTDDKNSNFGPNALT